MIPRKSTVLLHANRSSIANASTNWAIEIEIEIELSYQSSLVLSTE